MGIQDLGTLFADPGNPNGTTGPPLTDDAQVLLVNDIDGTPAVVWGGRLDEFARKLEVPDPSYFVNATGYLECNSTAAMEFVGDFELVVRAASYTYASSRTLIAKRSAGLGLHFMVSLSATGQIALGFKTAAGDQFSAALGDNPGYVDQAPYWWRIRRSAADGAVTMDYADGSSPAEPSVWTPLTMSGLQPSGNLVPNAAPLQFGVERSGATTGFYGEMYKAILRDGFDGTDVAIADLRLARDSFRSGGIGWTATAGQWNV